MGLKLTTRRRIRRRDRFTCWRCGAVEHEELNELHYAPRYMTLTGSSPAVPTSYFLFHVDHLIPRNRGGTDDDWNLSTSCGDCNLGRQDKLEERAVELVWAQFWAEWESRR